MSIVVCKKTRRQFLVGAGKTLLALPFLPSLFSNEAQAQVTGNLRRMMVFWLEHNVIGEYWPQRSFATTPVGNIGAMERSFSTLNNANQISPMMSNQVYETLRKQNLISMVRGMDVNLGGGHGMSSLGGNIVYEGGQILQSATNWPTIDSIIEASPSLYPAGEATVTKALRVNFNGGAYFLQKTGTQYQVLPGYGRDINAYYVKKGYYTIQTMYNDIFKQLTNGTGSVADANAGLKTNILNRVHASFVSFRNNRKVSSDDIARVDQHLGHIADLQRSLSASGSLSGISCGAPAVPGNMKQDPNVFIPAYMSLLVLAFKCGLTKFSAMKFEDGNGYHIPGLTLPTGINLHSAIHGNGDPNSPLKGQVHQAYNRYLLDQIANGFIKPMMELEGNTGKSYLDNMATVVLSQSGVETLARFSGHSSRDMQQMIIGSMGGRIRSGRYIALPEVKNPAVQRLPYNTYLITLLHLLGIPASEYSAYSNTGQGFGFYKSSAGHPLASRFYSPITELLT